MMSRAKTTINAPSSVVELKRPPTHPGEMLLEEFLKPLKMTQVEAARRLAMPLTRLNEVIRGKRGVTANTAIRLARLFKTTPEFWMGLQADWDLWHAARELRQAS
ncbi:MAG: HigA family addiction module antidote protein [Luteitalea sp.]|nr:HigA family addiction module antidote protein [Luteitalea sp.]